MPTSSANMRYQYARVRKSGIAVCCDLSNVGKSRITEDYAIATIKIFRPGA